VTSDAGLLLPRELGERLGLGTLVERHLSDPRTGRNAQFPLADLLRQSIYGRLAGYEDTNDAERAALPRTDSVERGPGSASGARPRSRRLILDIDSSESPVHGTQEQSAYNGHFESVCYHPLFVFNPEGDCLAAKLRPGNVHSAEGWDEILLPIIDRYRRRRRRVVGRADAAFARPEIYETLERRRVRYAIRLPANDVLERRIEDLLTRPRGRPSRAPLVRYRSFDYQAASWDRPRRVVAKTEHHLGDCSPGSASSSQRSRGRTGPWSASTTSAAPPSNGSRRARPRPTGPAFPVTASGPTRSDCSSE